MSACPSDEVMAAFADGDLDAAGRADVHRHVDGCTSCQALLRELASPASTTPTPVLPPPAAPPPEMVRRKVTPGYRPGDLLADRYRLEKLLGSGGMGTVWSALHLGTNRPVALKILRSDHRATPAARLRFLREARILGRIDHPNLTPVRDVFEDREAPVLAMDLLHGESLGERLTRRGRLPLDEVARLLPGALSAVQVAHDAGVVHRDLKPDNLFIVEATDGAPGGGEALRVLDFGIAKLIDDEDPAAVVITGKGEVLGTPPYMAPEQLRGDVEIDRRADVWALGVILYECLSGRRPFTGDRFVQFHQRVTTGQRDPLSVAAPQLPRDVVALVEKMLSVDREARCPDLREAIEVLSRHAVAKVESAPRGRGPRVAGLLAAGALAAALATGAVIKARGTTAVDPRRTQVTPAGLPDAGSATHAHTGATDNAPAAAPGTPTPCEKEWGATLSQAVCRSPALAMREAAYRVWRDLRTTTATDEEKVILEHERKALSWALNACGGGESCLLRRLQAVTPRIGVVDCAHAVSQDALTICKSAPLATLEGTLAAWYRVDHEHYPLFGRRLRKLPGGAPGTVGVIDPSGGPPRTVPTPAALSQQQTAWLVERHRCGADELCLARTLSARIAALRDIHRAFVGDDSAAAP